MSAESVSAADYHRLLEFRTGLRRFMKWSADRARESGLRPAHHQLLLAVKGHDETVGPTISDIADYLQLRHHSTVELIDRAEREGLVRRVTDPDDARVVRLQVTDEGETKLHILSAQHLHELERLAAHMSRLWAGLD
jgi:DNA-binding MarR family transcriptional regulator